MAMVNRKYQRGWQAAVAVDGTVAMQADWTRPDEEIAAYLARYDRYGIPFNAIYGPGAPSGIILPEVLTADAVLGTLKQASRGPRAMAGVDAEITR